MSKSASHSFTVRYFQKGPKLEVVILFDKKTEFKVELREGPSFALFFSSDLSVELYDKIVAWMEAYSLKKEAPMHFLPRQNLPTFSLRAVSALKGVLFGKSVSYEELAILANSPKATRAIGTICSKNPYPLFIPCHRVLAKGGVGGFAFGVAVKKELLKFEGIL